MLGLEPLTILKSATYLLKKYFRISVTVSKGEIENQSFANNFEKFSKLYPIISEMATNIPSAIRL